MSFAVDHKVSASNEGASGAVVPRDKELQSESTYDGANEPPLFSSQGMRRHLMANIDPKKCTSPLAAYCFMTGFIDSISFTAIFVWCGFQTGNTVQLGLALARLFSPGQTDFSFHIADQQALTSLLTFLFGASLGRIGDRLGNNSRLWLFLGTIIQSLFTMAAAIAAWKGDQGSIAETRGNPAWTDTVTFVAIGFMSAAVGLQGIMGKRVSSAFGTTVVLTTVWCELVADPKLFVRQMIISRDHRVLAVFALFVGGFVGRALLDQIGSAGALGIGTGIRLLIAVSWLFMPAKPTPGAAK